MTASDYEDEQIDAERHERLEEQAARHDEWAGCAGACSKCALAVHVCVRCQETFLDPSPSAEQHRNQAGTADATSSKLSNPKHPRVDAHTLLFNTAKICAVYVKFCGSLMLQNSIY